MINIKNLSVSYEDGQNIVKGITNNIGDGECVLLAGGSGSGKSSIINSINGLAFEYENAKISGSIEVDGKQIRNLPLYEVSLLISSVFQNPKTHFFNVDTTLELLFYLENIGLNRKEMDYRKDEMLKVFPIKHLLDRNIFELSGGEKQILCVASCYISGCKIIVLDEPSSNLDEKYIDVLKKMLEILKNKGITLILAEHRIYYLMDVVDRILLINKGKISNEFSREEFLRLNNNDLKKLGLRSKDKTNLDKLDKFIGKDLLIKKLQYDFKGKGYLDIENLSFGLGKIYGIVGENGCGKSSFIYAMTGLRKSGKVEILFKNSYLSKKDRIKNSSLVMQDVNNQLFTDSVINEVKLGIENIEHEKIDDILSKLGLAEFKERHPLSLSGGQKQRVAIASILCRSSRFIFLDEPTSGMDYKNMLKISKLIKEIISDENIIFVVSHDNEFLNETVDKVINLKDYRN